MRKTMFGGFLLAALILAGGVSPDTVVAQAKKDDKATKKDDKAAKKDDKKDAKAGVIEITKGKDDKFRFFVRDGEGKLLAMSGPGGFATPKDAEAAIDHLKEVISKAKPSVVSKDDK
jgi:uncharacterized protein YegP (UPF0339 family)